MNDKRKKKSKPGITEIFCKRTSKLEGEREKILVSED